MATLDPPSTVREPAWARTYPPLLLIVGVFLLAAFIMPSSLNLPQSNPSTVLEYAPVPPEDDAPTPPEGNVSSLGLGSSQSLATRGARERDNLALPDPDQDPSGRGDRPKDVRCVGHTDPDGSFVLRQTEDPMSPECVPFFEGDNFGETHQGVTADEITVVLYYDTGGYSGGTRGPAAGEVTEQGIYDIDAKPKPRCPQTYPQSNPNSAECDHIIVRSARALSRHFNSRYQTYNRYVHFWLFVSSSQTEAARRTDAVKIWKELKPFAVLDLAKFHGHNEAFEDSLAAREILTFTSRTALRSAFFEKNRPYAWGFWPDVEHWADLYSSYVCQKLVGEKVRWSGNPQGNPQNGYNNRERRFGLWHTSAESEPGLVLFGRIVKQKLLDCGANIVDDKRYANTGFATDNNDPGTDQAQAVASFKTNDVTTVLWLGGIESKFTKEADAAQYYPEIVIAGDLDMDGTDYGQLQSKAVFQNAWGTSYQLRQDAQEERPSTRAARGGDPQIDMEAALYAQEMFRDLFMLFQTVQVAGPRLTPEQVDKGMHALKKNRSSTPYRAAFFFDQDDFSSIKDSMLIWWSNDEVAPDENTPGCWMMVRGPITDAPGGGYGHRSLADEWDQFGQDPFADRGAPCTAHPGRAGIRP